MNSIPIDIDKARGAMLGQMIGDALGGSLEFGSAESIKSRFPNGFGKIVGGGPFRLKPGQVTDDTELALALARSLVKYGLDFDRIAQAYVDWKRSGPFDCGGTCGSAFGWYGGGKVSEAAMRDKVGWRESSQANGALMRISPMAIFGHALNTIDFTKAVERDAALSHASNVCAAANAVFCEAIRWGLRGATPDVMFAKALAMARENERRIKAPSVLECLTSASASDDINWPGGGIGWVLKALHMAFWSLIRTPKGRDPEDFRKAMSHVVVQGGDTDTNGAIAGALLGSWYGFTGLPEDMTKTVLSCKTPRGKTYQCSDALELTQALIQAGIKEAKKRA